MNIDNTKNIDIASTQNTELPEKSLKKGSFTKALEHALSSDHRIKKGDTLWHIVKGRLKSTKGQATNHEIVQGVKQIAQWNLIENPNLIYPGHTIDVSPIAGIDKDIEAFKDQISKNRASSAAQELPAAGDEQPPDAPAVITGEQAMQFPPPSQEPAEEQPALKPKETLWEQMAKYKIDQLLAAPGGKDVNFEPEEGAPSLKNSYESFGQRIGKDLSDAKENMVQLGKDLTTGADSRFLAPDGSISTRRRPGLLKTLESLTKDLASGFSFGAYMPEGEKKVEGAARIKYFFKKVFNDAILKDAGKGIPSALVSGMQHAVLAALNGLEAVPDATIGNIEAGRKITNTVFDNGQVAVSYITDIMPGGEAWFRVHSPGSQADGWSMPVYYNLKTEEQGVADPRWEAVRNTPFRKTIETIGALLADDSILRLFGKAPLNLPSDLHGNRD